MRLGVHLPQYGRAASPEAIASVAVRAEELGFADVWVSDHVAIPASQGYPSPYLFDPVLTLGMALLLRLGDVMRIHLRQGQRRYAFVVRKRCHGLNLDQALRSRSLMGQRCS